MDNKILSFIPKFYFPGSIFLGSQSFLFLKTIQDDKKLIITSEAFRVANQKMLADLFGSSLEYFLQNNEPINEDFDKLKKLCLEGSFKYLIAFGGGSVMDLAKLVKAELKIKMVAIPTTIGSGAEVSQHALLISGGLKKIFSSSDLLPEVVLLNPSCLKSLDREKIIFQSIDALSHGIESLVSKISNLFSDQLALKSIEIIYENLSNIDSQENKDKILENLQIASILAGFAQSSAATGLIHAFAHHLGPKNNINHSKAVAIFLLDVLKLNFEHTDKYEKLNQLKNLSSNNFITLLQQLFNKLDIKLEKINISGDLEKIAEEIKKDICTLSNPYSPSIEDIVEILKKHQ